MNIKDARQLTDGEVSMVEEGAMLDYPYVETESEALFEVSDEQAAAITQAIIDKAGPSYVNGQGVIAVHQRPGWISSSEGKALNSK